MLISVVIPTLNEARRLPALLADLSGNATANEVIVADGGSEDDTCRIAHGHGARVVSAPRGRGRQLAAGAAAADGDILLFLHADSRVSPGALDAVAEALTEHAAVIGGNFRLVFDGGDPFSLWLTGFYAWLRRHGRYYGDSGVFVRREAYAALGGIRPLSLMEDYDFNRRLERFGKTACIEDPPLRTSSRRFQGRRRHAIIGGWLTMHALFHLGVAPERLAELYDSARRRTGF